MTGVTYNHFGFLNVGVPEFLLALMPILIIVAFLAVLVLTAFYLLQPTKQLERPRKPNTGDLVSYFILVWLLNAFGLFIVIMLWSKNHVKNGEWWGWWDSKKRGHK